MNEILTEVESFAKLLLNPREIAIILGLDEVEFQMEMEQEEGDYYKAYMKGFVMTEIEVRKSVIDLAKSGSGPAQNEVLKLIDQFKNTKL